MSVVKEVGPIRAGWRSIECCNVSWRFTMMMRRHVIRAESWSPFTWAGNIITEHGDIAAVKFEIVLDWLGTLRGTIV